MRWLRLEHVSIMRKQLSLFLSVYCLLSFTDAAFLLVLFAHLISPVLWYIIVFKTAPHLQSPNYCFKKVQTEDRRWNCYCFFFSFLFLLWNPASSEKKGRAGQRQLLAGYDEADRGPGDVEMSSGKCRPHRNWSVGFDFSRFESAFIIFKRAWPGGRPPGIQQVLHLSLSPRCSIMRIRKL